MYSVSGNKKIIHIIQKINSTANLSISSTLRSTSLYSSWKTLMHPKKPRSSATLSAVCLLQVTFICVKCGRAHLNHTPFVTLWQKSSQHERLSAMQLREHLARFQIKQNHQYKPIYRITSDLRSQEHKTSSLCCWRKEQWNIGRAPECGRSCSTHLQAGLVPPTKAAFLPV